MDAARTIGYLNTYADLHGQDEWGRAVRFASDGRPVVFERDLGRGERMFTFVTWVN